MLTRSISSVVVVIVGLLPLVLGGPVFAVLMAALSIAAYHEYLSIGNRVLKTQTSRVAYPGYLIIALFALAGLRSAENPILFALSLAAFVAPFLVALVGGGIPGSAASWAFSTAGTLYLGLPAFAAVSLRTFGGDLTSNWLSEFSSRAAVAWEAAPRGLAWALLVVLATWLGDSAALLVGRSLGRHKLAPRLSPNKTVEGSIGGLVAAITAGMLVATVFGLGSIWIGGAAGAVVGIAGQSGDLCESLLKRQAGVKDSGALIPGHGGMLDRIDALLFAFPAGYLFASLTDAWLK
ncbi:MAG: phosphatidate cytidylyltransferase [Thermomicrobiales bacterium]